MDKLIVTTSVILCFLPQFTTTIDIQQYFSPSNHDLRDLLSAGISKRCLDSLHNLTIAQRLKLLDVQGRPRSGILSGNLLWFGSFDDCLSLDNTRYCLASVKAVYPNTTSVRTKYGLCIPDGCNETDVINGVESLFKNVINRYIPSFQLDTSPEQSGLVCYKDPPINGRVKFAIVVFSLILLCCVIGTLIDIINETIRGDGNVLPAPTTTTTSIPRNGIYDKLAEFDPKILVEATEIAPLMNGVKPHYRTTSQNGKPKSEGLMLSTKDERQEEKEVVKSREPFLQGLWADIFLCFSVLSNARKVFDTNVGRDSITSLNGIRVLSLFWVILGHVYIRAWQVGIVENPVKFADEGERFTMLAITNGLYSVDTFLFLSGLLLAYIVFSKIDKNDGSINWAWFYLHRYLRLTPLLMLVILFIANIEEFFCEAPLCYSINFPEKCRKYWWTNLLYINNFHPNFANDSCMPVVWYLAIDMQFFIITPIFIYVFSRFRTKGVLISTSFVVLLSGIITAILIHHYDINIFIMLPGNMRLPGFPDKSQDFGEIVYAKPYCRIQPYMVGMAVGYFMYAKTFKTKTLGWFRAIVIWMIVTALALTLVYVPYNTSKHDGRKWTSGEYATFGSVRHLLWALVLAWVVYACEYGYAGYIKEFLSARFWIPLGRLNYAAYLCHYQLITVMYAGYKTGLHYSTSVMIYIFCATLLLSYGIAFLFAVTIEFPFSNLERTVTERLGKKHRKK